MRTKDLLLVIATGTQRYREYLLDAISARFRIHLLNCGDPAWERRYISGATVLPSMDTGQLVAAARNLAAAQPVAGVLTWDEALIVSAARVAEELGLPGAGPEAVQRCRDKYQTRRALDAFGVPQPRFALVSNLDQALLAAEDLGYPVVLKPRSAAGSYGISLVTDSEQLAARFAFSREATMPGAPQYEMAVLVEEYVDAPEISIDSAVFRGTVIPVFLAHKELGYAPYFEEVGHYVSHTDPLLSDPEMRRVLWDTHAALGYAHGWTHAEFKLTATGPKVIEVNGRLGGDMIPYLGMRASGINPGLAAADVACGRRPVMVSDRSFVSGVRFFYPAHEDAVVESVTFDESQLPTAIDSVVPLVEPGSTVSPPPKGLISGRVAFATTVAETQDACRHALDRAQAALRLSTAYERTRTTPGR